MADLDSRSKRASSVGVLLPFVLAPVLPDGTISQGDRQHVAFSYSGVLASVSAALTEMFYVLSKMELTRNILSAVELTRSVLSQVAKSVDFTSEVD